MATEVLPGLILENKYWMQGLFYLLYLINILIRCLQENENKSMVLSFKTYRL